jgi:hypothetical protein
LEAQTRIFLKSGQKITEEDQKDEKGVWRQTLPVKGSASTSLSLNLNIPQRAAYQRPSYGFFHLSQRDL